MSRLETINSLPREARRWVMDFHSDCFKYTALIVTTAMVYFFFFMGTSNEASFSVFMIPITIGIYITQKKLIRKYVTYVDMDLTMHKFMAHMSVGAHGRPPTDLKEIEQNIKMRHALAKARALIVSGAINTVNRFACWLMLGFYSSGVAIYLIERYL